MLKTIAKKLGKAEAPARDPGLVEIDDLERNIVLGKRQLWEWNGVSAAEIDRELPAVAAVAAAVCNRLRDEYLQRQERSS